MNATNFLMVSKEECKGTVLPLSSSEKSKNVAFFLKSTMNLLSRKIGEIQGVFVSFISLFNNEQASLRRRLTTLEEKRSFWPQFGPQTLS